MRIKLYPYPNGPWQSIWTKNKVPDLLSETLL